MSEWQVGDVSVWTYHDTESSDPVIVVAFDQDDFDMASKGLTRDDARELAKALLDAIESTW